MSHVQHLVGSEVVESYKERIVYRRVRNNTESYQQVSVLELSLDSYSLLVVDLWKSSTFLEVGPPHEAFDYVHPLVLTIGFALAELLYVYGVEVGKLLSDADFHF